MSLNVPAIRKVNPPGAGRRPGDTAARPPVAGQLPASLSVSRSVKYAGLGWKSSVYGVAEPSPSKTPGTHEYLSENPQRVYETQLRTSRQARSSSPKPSAWAAVLIGSAG